MYGALDISTGGMVAQRTRAETIAANIANRGTILDKDGQVNPYRRRQVMFAPGDPSATTKAGREMGVHVARIDVDQSPFNMRWDPDSPYAYKTGQQAGYVPEPNINPAVEQINMLEASRAYEANVSAAEATKSMFSQMLRLLA